DPLITWGAGLTLAATVVAGIVQLRKLAASRHTAVQDPVRAYPSHIRKQSFSLAGNRCEYTGPWGLRCRAPAEHADHFWPWVKGGATSLQNCVASCARHNTSKGAKMLGRSTQRALQRRRRRYFPPGTDVTVGQWYTPDAAPAPVPEAPGQPAPGVQAPATPAPTAATGEPDWARQPAQW
ncbi:MAG TPA: HNH endonuclease signature motif containing protein, partial [Beutenbergiaceae bacterium]|nr:HNH endonuclease signature motif containing protein [Beutenbergiaceae bacterium]